jgi:hypothetical protein
MNTRINAVIRRFTKGLTQLDRNVPTSVQSAIRDVWEHYEDEAWRKDQSHHRGQGRWADDARWRGIGEGTLAKLRFLATANGRDMPLRPTVLEWGPGGGANLHGLRNLAATYVGVDISQKNLDEAARMISAVPDAEVRFVPKLLTVEPSKLSAELPACQLFLSTACFQHFPSKDYGVEVLRTVFRACQPRAFGIIQIRYDNGNEKYRAIRGLHEYRERHLTATSYGLDEFWAIAKEVGFEPLFVRDFNTRTNYATFYLSVPGTE